MKELGYKPIIETKSNAVHLFMEIDNERVLLEDNQGKFVDKEVYVLVDADDAGEKLRKQFRKEFPQAEHIYIDRSYREVATAPSSHLANVLWGADIDVYTEYLR
ncbi:hypothetical protein ACT453_22325 [Bacillus sp. D-CC]